MISKAKLKFVKSLQVKKYRKQEQCFMVEGVKSVSELLQSNFEIVLVMATPANVRPLRSLAKDKAVEWLEASEKDLAECGSFQTNDGAIAIARMKPNEKITLAKNEYGLVLDDIRDPGNLGTIIRTADWYGITKILASEETTDLYNPKVITASMGSFTRVSVFYTDIAKYLKSDTFPRYGTFLGGTSIYETTFDSQGWIIIGNESNGISHGVEKLVTIRITIPKRGNAESLNAAVATAIVLDNVMRLKK